MPASPLRTLKAFPNRPLWRPVAKAVIRESIKNFYKTNSTVRNSST